MILYHCDGVLEEGTALRWDTLVIPSRQGILDHHRTSLVTLNWLLGWGSNLPGFFIVKLPCFFWKWVTSIQPPDQRGQHLNNLEVFKDIAPWPSFHYLYQCRHIFILPFGLQSNTTLLFCFPDYSSFGQLELFELVPKSWLAPILLFYWALP